MRYKERPETFGKDDYKYNKLLKYALVLITIYLIIISLLPLMQKLLNKAGFTIMGISPYTLDSFKASGYGSYVHTSEKFQVTFSDVTEKSNKPKVALHISSVPSYLIELVELSDRGSFINSRSMQDAKLMTNLTDENTLMQTYDFGDFNVIKITKISDIVEISYKASQPVEYNLAFWRWYFKDVNDIDAKSMAEPASTLTGINEIFFTLDGVDGYGKILISKESDVTIEKDDIGIHKLIAKTNAQDLTVQITGEVTAIKTSPVVAFVSNAFSNDFVIIAFPLFTILILALAWRGWSK